MENSKFTTWLQGKELTSQKPQEDLSSWLATPPRSQAQALVSPIVQTAEADGSRFIEPLQLPATTGNEARLKMRDWMKANSSSSAVSTPPRPQVPPPPAAKVLDPGKTRGNSAQGQRIPLPSETTSSLAPSLLGVVGQIKYELESTVGRLLTLNPSRREAVATHLEGLAQLPASPTHSFATGDSAGGLRRWIDGPRTPSQNLALQVYFEEVAIVALGQALLLKAWNDRGVRPLREEDLGRMNWALSSTLKPFLPHDREGWQITRPNLYSWYNPGASIQKEIWRAFENWEIGQESAQLLASLIRMARRKLSSSGDLSGYDERFFSAVWDKISSFGFQVDEDLNGFRRKKLAFSPTLRDGSISRLGPDSLSWVGVESHPFKMIVAELALLWWCPQAPPLWAIGSGLEVHERDQLSLGLGSPKPSIFSKIAEMEACDLGFVLEEKILRLNHRSAESAKLKAQLDSLPYFKKLRSHGSSLGTLQSCVTLSKLRPGGLLFWAREERLSEADGEESLRSLLDFGKLLCEWRFTDVSHSLPGQSSLFPKYLYLICRETDLKTRLSHRPIRIAIQGQIRSHVEVPLLLDDALSAYASELSGRKVVSRGNWQLHVQVSPTTQKEWAERWPEPANADMILALERLKTQSIPMATVCTVRPTPAGDPLRDGAWSAAPGSKGFWFRAVLSETGTRQIETLDLPIRGIDETGRACILSEAKGQGFVVLVPDSSWTYPLRNYLESACVSRWLNHHCERKGEQWSVTEQTAKYIPIPHRLHQQLSTQTTSLSEDWEKLLGEIGTRPHALFARISTLSLNDPVCASIKSRVFIEASRAVGKLKENRSHLLNMVRADGSIRWKTLLEILPRSEKTSITLHSEARMVGGLSPHQPISRITRIKAPMPGYLFAAENGQSLHLAIENSRLLEILGDQLESLQHPTWTELVQNISLPRSLEMIEAAAEDVLRSHGECSSLLKALRECISACSEF